MIAIITLIPHILSYYFINTNTKNWERMINHELVLDIAEKEKDMTLRKEQMLET